MSEKIALLVDSGMDVPTTVLNKDGVYVVPLNIIYPEGTYIDKVTITSKEIYDRLSNEIPSTSLPNGESIDKIFNQIIEDGYSHLVIATISSGLSGTHNILKLMAKDYDNLICGFIDSLSIGIGGGLQGVAIKEMIDNGQSFDTIVSQAQENIEKSRVFFSIPTLEYLKKGGRIGLVTSILGTALNLNPVISCNKEGIYYTVTKARGRKKSLEKMVQEVEKFVGNHSSYDLAVAYGNCVEEAKALKEALEQRFHHINQIFIDEVSPALGVHTGPGVLGIGVIKR
ncbi:DegV family protein [Vagococcus xieshaowenii]|uniref:DegV family protein n=1 Tax=Vagococcus xieshaowenii TaxID=2562451 RepID=A0AAJ5JQE5_9ENTE|nr:DegV family protein [Vagococcus xieshaowenii]QCA28579.1 DegV family protein [Vagococcus xieshaowenii]TFZ40613.1 DegV family protein [Vagococcus xieshaowenii]